MDEDALADRARQLYAWDNRIAVLTALDDAQARIAELERQRDAVLALHQPMPHDPTRCGICHQADQSCGCCGSWDENDRWPCKTVEIYGGGQ